PCRPGPMWTLSSYGRTHPHLSASKKPAAKIQACEHKVSISIRMPAHEVENGAIERIRLLPISRVSRIGDDDELGVLDARGQELHQRWRRGHVCTACEDQGRNANLLKQRERQLIPHRHRVRELEGGGSRHRRPALFLDLDPQARAVRICGAVHWPQLTDLWWQCVELRRANAVFEIEDLLVLHAPDRVSDDEPPQARGKG